MRTIWTELGLIVEGVVLAFFPAMAFVAVDVVWTSITVVYYKIGRFPVFTRDGFIRTYMRLPPIVLPVMSVHA